MTRTTTFAIPTVETERLILRAPHVDDLPGLTGFFTTERSRMVGGPRDELGSWQALVARIGHWAINGFGLWHLTERASGRLVGWTGMIVAPGWDEPELGWTVLEEAEGKGIAFEAASAARTFAARHQGLDGVISYIARSNHRSRALAGRLGAWFERDGELLGKACQVFRHPTQEIA